MVDRGLAPANPVAPQGAPPAIDHFAHLLTLMATASGGKIPYQHRMRKKYPPIPKV